jgi:hypothetical protein
MSRRTRRVPGLVLGLALVLATPGVAAGDVFKCVRNGKTTFTSDPSQCPGGRAQELEDRVQTVPTRAPAPARAAPRTSVAPPSAVDGQAEMWRRKREDAERELHILGQEMPDYEKYVGWCGNGDTLWAKDEAGLKRRVPCSQVRADLARMRARREQLEQYLAGGLEEECRRAGCLPGWVR